MLREVPEPVEAGGFQRRVFGQSGGASGGRRKGGGDGAGDERGALLLQPLDQLSLLRHQPVNPPRLPVQKRRDGALLDSGDFQAWNRAEDLKVEPIALLTARHVADMLILRN